MCFSIFFNFSISSPFSPFSSISSSCLIYFLFFLSSHFFNISSHLVSLFFIISPLFSIYASSRPSLLSFLYMFTVSLSFPLSPSFLNFVHFTTWHKIYARRSCVHENILGRNSKAWIVLASEPLNRSKAPLSEPVVETEMV